MLNHIQCHRITGSQQLCCADYWRMFAAGMTHREKRIFYIFPRTTFVVVGWCATEVKSSHGMVFFHCIGVAIDRTIDDVIEEPGDAVPRTGGALTVQVVSDLHMPSLKSSTPHMLRGHRRSPSRVEFTNSLCSVGTYNIRWHNQYVASNRRRLPR